MPRSKNQFLLFRLIHCFYAAMGKNSGRNRMPNDKRNKSPSSTLLKNVNTEAGGNLLSSPAGKPLQSCASHSFSWAAHEKECHPLPPFSLSLAAIHSRSILTLLCCSSLSFNLLTAFFSVPCGLEGVFMHAKLLFWSKTEESFFTVSAYSICIVHACVLEHIEPCITRKTHLIGVCVCVCVRDPGPPAGHY